MRWWNVALYRLPTTDYLILLEVMTMRNVSGRFAVVTVLLMLLLVPFAVALANPPEGWYWEGSGTDPGLIDCGDFIIDGEWSAWERGKTFFDKDGNVVRENIHYHFLGKLTNRTTGLTIRDEGYSNAKIDYVANTQTSSGVIWNLNVPGHGVIALDAGTVVFDMDTWEMLHEGGPHQVLHGLDVVDALCSYLE
jgi:hypothetical protein